MNGVKKAFISYANKRLILSDVDKSLISHGIDIIVSDGRNFLSVFFLSFLFHKTKETLLYLVILSCLRGHTGGWHSESEFGCFVSYNLSYILIISIMNLDLSVFVMSVLVLFSIVYINMFAPVEHPNNPLSHAERIRNKEISFFYTFLFSMLYIVLLGSGHVLYAKMILLMEILRRSKKRGNHGK